LRTTVDRLEGMLALRAELDTMVAHEVRTPLTVVHGVLVTLGLLPPGHPDAPVLMAQALAYVGRLADAVKHLLVPPGQAAGLIVRAALEAVAFGAVADRALDEVAHRHPDARVVVDVPPDMSVTTSESRLEALLVHLIDHGCERADGNAVELRARREDDVLRIEVADLGGPAPDAADEAIGLYLARMLARSMGGELTLGDRSGGGCMMMVELPQRRHDDVAPSPDTADQASD
jgi:K+-sensing histidine kinase KdpD